MNILLSGTNEIVTSSSITITSVLNYAITFSIYVNQTVTYAIGTSSTSDVQIQSNDQSISLNSNTNYVITPDLTCSSSGAISITYSISNYNSIPAPTWVSINSSTGELTISTPSVSTNTNFNFYVVSAVNGVADPIKKLLKLTVLDWLTQHSNIWTCNEDNSKWWGDGSVESIYGEQWDDGNLISGDGWSSTWQIEAGYNWELFAAKNDISYWTKVWGNGIINKEEQWDDGNLVNGDGWSENCSIESGYFWDILKSPSFWYPNWGNGKRDLTPIAEQWDDSNNLDFDGCSSKWTIEDNFVCSNSTGIDIWSSIYSSPIIKSSSFDSSNLEIVIEFDQEMKNENLSDFDISLDIYGSNSPYSISWSANFNKENLKIRFASYPELIGGINEIIWLQITNTQHFKSTHNITLNSPQSYKFSVSKPNVSEAVSTTASAISYMFIFTMLISIGVSLITGGSIELMWSLANTLQVMFFYALLDLNFTPELLTVFEFMKYSNFDNPIFEFIRSKSKILMSFINISVPSTFESIGYSSISILKYYLFSTSMNTNF